MSDLYREVILDHYKHPRNFGTLPACDLKGSEDNAVCGDRVAWQLQFDGDTVVTVRWNGEGCALSQAAASLLSEKLVGKKRETLNKITDKDILSLIGTTMNPSRQKCATLCVAALQKTLSAGDSYDCGCKKG